MSARRWILPVVLGVGLANGLYQAGRETADLARENARGPRPWLRFVEACRTRIPAEARVLIAGDSNSHFLATHLYPRPIRLVERGALAAAAAAEPGAWVVDFPDPFEPGQARICPAHDLR